MAKRSHTKLNGALLNPIFHKQTQEEDDKTLTPGMIKIVRRTGQLNLSSRSLATVPKKLFTMYELEDPATLDYDLSTSNDEAWWICNSLTYLDMSSNVLKDIPGDIKLFADLKVLNLQDNCLSEVPAEIGLLTKLTKLNLNRNKIQSLPGSFYKLTELQQLLLAHNNLSEVIADVGDLIMLQQLDLSHNELVTVSPGLGFLSRLTDLNMSHNKLTELPSEISSLRVLSKIDVTHNNIKLLPNLSGMRKLQYLYAQHNDIEELPIINGCEIFQELYLGNNYIKDISTDFCQDANHLKILDLRDNKVESVPNEIAAMYQLIRLDLGNNELESLPGSLSLLPHLQNLQIEGNKLKQIRNDIVKAGTIRILKYLRETLNVETEKDVAPSINNGLYLPTPTFPDSYTMKHSRALTVSMLDLNHVPDSVFEEAKKAEINTIDLSNNKLAAVPEGFKVIVSNLTEINLSNNRLTVLPDYFSECNKLLYLNLSHNLLSDLPPDLPKAKFLRELVISNNKFLNIPQCVYEIPALEILMANNNLITEIDINNFLKLKFLASLSLANNDINHIPPELGNMKHLRSLELTGNSFRQPRYAILQQGTETTLSYLRDRIPRENGK